jgi:hypothetical protein
MIAECIYSVNKRAKNYRDKVREYIKSPYYSHLQDNIDNAIAKKVEYYGMKEELLKKFSPTVIHKQFVKNTKRVYSYEEDYQKNLVEKEADITRKGNYFDNERCTKIHFFDYQIENNLYFFYYEIGGFSFHKPINEVEAIESGLNIVEIDENFKTYGRKIEDLLSVPFVRKVLNLLNSGDYTIVE